LKRASLAIITLASLLCLMGAASAGPVTGLAAAQIEQFGQGDHKAWPDARLDRIGADVIKASERPKLKATFRVLNVDAKNALASADRKIYVTKGLYDAADDDGLAFVLGHEVAHIEKDHHSKATLTNLGAALGAAVLSKGKSRGAQTGIAIGAGYFTSKQSRRWEREADRWGIRWAYGAGYDPNGALAVFRLFKQEPGGSSSGLFGHLFADHPDVDLRMQLARKEIRELTGQEPKTDAAK
jgi:predicted Zn-dependent protease